MSWPKELDYLRWWYFWKRKLVVNRTRLLSCKMVIFQYACLRLGYMKLKIKNTIAVIRLQMHLNQINILLSLHLCFPPSATRYMLTSYFTLFYSLWFISLLGMNLYSSKTLKCDSGVISHCSTIVSVFSVDFVINSNDIFCSLIFLLWDIRVPFIWKYKKRRKEKMQTEFA